MTHSAETASVQDVIETSAPQPSPESTSGVDVKQRPRRRSRDSGIQSLLSIAVIVIFVITFVVQAFRVPSESMENTLLIGDFLLADKLHFAGTNGALHNILPYRAIQRGDIIVFRYPVDPDTYFVKRVIGVPGDHIRLRDKTVYVNGTALRESYTIYGFNDYDSYRDDFPSPRSFSTNVDYHWRGDMPRFISNGELIVPEGHFFVMGDNRDRSLDSRYWGFVPRANIVGRPLVIYLSVRGFMGDSSAADGKLFPSGHLLAHVFQLARWDRMFRLVK
jgi:signal peptidase I